MRFVEDDELPEGHDFALVRKADDMWFFVKESRISERMLESAWAAYRLMAQAPDGPNGLRLIQQQSA